MAFLIFLTLFLGYGLWAKRQNTKHIHAMREEYWQKNKFQMGEGIPIFREKS